MADRNDIVAELKVKLDMLIKSHQNLEKYKEAAIILKKENDDLKKRYEDLKTASTFTGSENNIRETKLYISRLIKEIDKCIALLNA